MWWIKKLESRQKTSKAKYRNVTSRKNIESKTGGEEDLKNLKKIDPKHKNASGSVRTELIYKPQKKGMPEELRHLNDIRDDCNGCDNVSDLYNAIGLKWDYFGFRLFLRVFDLLKEGDDHQKFLLISKGEKEITQAHLEEFAGAPFHVKSLVKKLSEDFSVTTGDIEKTEAPEEYARRTKKDPGMRIRMLVPNEKPFKTAPIIPTEFPDFSVFKSSPDVPTTFPEFSVLNSDPENFAVECIYGSDNERKKEVVNPEGMKHKKKKRKPVSPPDEDVCFDPEPQLVLDVGNSVNPNPPTEWIAQLEAVNKKAGKAAQKKALARMSAREKSKHLERLIRKEERSIERLKKERERMAKEQAERIKEAKNLKNLAQQRKKKWKVGQPVQCIINSTDEMDPEDACVTRVDNGNPYCCFCSRPELGEFDPGFICTRPGKINKKRARALRRKAKKAKKKADELPEKKKEDLSHLDAFSYVPSYLKEACENNKAGVAVARDIIGRKGVFSPTAWLEVSGIPPMLSEVNMCDIFRTCGPIKNVISREFETKRKLAVEYESWEHAHFAQILLDDIMKGISHTGEERFTVKLVKGLKHRVGLCIQDDRFTYKEKLYISKYRDQLSMKDPQLPTIHEALMD